MPLDANKLIVGECRAVMRALPERSVQCVVTSPPYWGLRDYGLPPVAWSDGWSGCYGLEPNPEMFIGHTLEVFREVRRILRDDGTLFMNFGDSYSAGTTAERNPSANHGGNGYGKHGYWINENNTHRVNDPSRKTGELLNLPHKIAEALSADGWYWRSTIIWAKRAPMPESISGWRWKRCKVKVSPNSNHDSGKNGEHVDRRKVGFNDRYDFPEVHAAHYEPCPGCDKCRANDGIVLRRGKWRPTTAHEYVFLFSKSERYFSDGDAVQEIASGANSGRENRPRGTFESKGEPPLPGRDPFRAVTETRNPRSVITTESTARDLLAYLIDKGVDLSEVPELFQRGPASVWTLSSEPFKAAHFATFPTMLAKRCIEAGTSAGGCCPVCESPLAPMIETSRVPTRPGLTNQIDETGMANRDPQRHVAVSKITGYRPTCGCNAGAPIGCLVFDPFAGSGTTLQTARALGRRYLGSELNEEYAAMAEQRIMTPPKWKELKKKPKPRPESPGQLQMFA